MSQPALHFRAAVDADVPMLYHLVTSAYRGDSSRVGWTTEADLLGGMRIDADRIQQEIDRSRSRIIVAEDHGKPVACAHVCDNDGAGYFGMFAVRPSLQGGGMGRQVLAEAERVAREEWHLPKMRMMVIDVREELIAWYERRGYHRTGEHQPFPYGDERYGLPKRDDLRFEVLEKAL